MHDDYCVIPSLCRKVNPEVLFFKVLSQGFQLDSSPPVPWVYFEYFLLGNFYNKLFSLVPLVLD